MFKLAKYLSATLLFAASCSSFSQAAPAAVNPAAIPGFQFTGAGTLTCKEAQPLLANQESSAQFEQWLHGFLAAYNAFSTPGQRVNLPPSQALMAYSRDICKEYPDVRFIAVAASVLQQLGAKVPALQ